MLDMHCFPIYFPNRNRKSRFTALMSLIRSCRKKLKRSVTLWCLSSVSASASSHTQIETEGYFPINENLALLRRATDQHSVFVVAKIGWSYYRKRKGQGRPAVEDSENSYTVHPTANVTTVSTWSQFRGFRIYC